jgi:hypothetical protein
MPRSMKMQRALAGIFLALWVPLMWHAPALAAPTNAQTVHHQTVYLKAPNFQQSNTGLGDACYVNCGNVHTYIRYTFCFDQAAMTAWNCTGAPACQSYAWNSYSTQLAWKGSTIPSGYPGITGGCDYVVYWGWMRMATMQLRIYGFSSGYWYFQWYTV